MKRHGGSGPERGPDCMSVSDGRLHRLCAVAAATGTLKPEVPEPAFDPEMNGHYENVVADNGDMVRVPIPTTTRQENSSEPMSAALPTTSAMAKAS